VPENPPPHKSTSNISPYFVFFVRPRHSPIDISPENKSSSLKSFQSVFILLYKTVRFYPPDSFGDVVERNCFCVKFFGIKANLVEDCHSSRLPMLVNILEC